MRRTIIIAACALILGVALGVWAQATVALFPSQQVSAAKRADAVWGVCYAGGYSGDWGNQTAMWAFYRQQLIRHLRAQYRQAKHMEAMGNIPDLDLPE